MKKNILLFLLFASFGMLAQEYQIQLRLVDGNVGYPTGDPMGNYLAVSNDAGLNTIFDTYGADHYFELILLLVMDAI